LSGILIPLNRRPMLPALPQQKFCGVYRETLKLTFIGSDFQV
jgi:hypothetical protein